MPHRLPFFDNINTLSGDEEFFFSVVIPVFNAQDTIEELIQRLGYSMSKIGVEHSYEIIAIDDASDDHSPTLIANLALENSKIHLVRHVRNIGECQTILEGLAIAKGKWIAVLDCDLEDIPEQLPELFKLAVAYNQTSIAIRNKRPYALWRRITSTAFYYLLNAITLKTFENGIGNFRVMPKRDAHNLLGFANNLDIPHFGILTQLAGIPYKTLNVQSGARKSGKSGYTLTKLFKLGIRLIRECYQYRTSR